MSAFSIDEELKWRSFIGIVEDNNDPKKLGRCKIRVFDIFDTILVDDIPWASPHKDLNGNSINIPDKGKVVSVTFDSGNIYTPEYNYAQHFNINLKNKLAALSGDDYITMKSLLFDHKVQIWSNDSTGLKLDYNKSNINLTKSGNIAINLRDNSSYLYLGTEDADQAAILGNTWMNWFDKLVSNLLSGPYIGNLGAPVVANPAFIQILQEYTEKRKDFLSEHVWIVDNFKVKAQSRDADATLGDTIKITNKVLEKQLNDRGVTNQKDNNYQPVNLEQRVEDKTNNLKNNDGEKPDHWRETSFEPSNVPMQADANFSQYPAGQYPLDKMKISFYMNKYLNGDSRHLIPAAADSLDALLNAYKSSSFTGKQPLKITSGYRTQKDQDALYAKYGAPQAAKTVGAHGRGTAVDFWWGIQTTLFKDKEKRPAAWRHPVYKWFFENAPKFGWSQPDWASDDAGAQDEWWHWEYFGKTAKSPKVASRYTSIAFNETRDVAIYKQFGGRYTSDYKGTGLY